MNLITKSLEVKKVMKSTILIASIVVTMVFVLSSCNNQEDIGPTVASKLAGNWIMDGKGRILNQGLMFEGDNIILIERTAAKPWTISREGTFSVNKDKQAGKGIINVVWEDGNTSTLPYTFINSDVIIISNITADLEKWDRTSEVIYPLPIPE